jgi:hypothetical protein
VREKKDKTREKTKEMMKQEIEKNKLEEKKEIIQTYMSYNGKITNFLGIVDKLLLIRRE